MLVRWDAVGRRSHELVSALTSLPASEDAIAQIAMLDDIAFPKALEQAVADGMGWSRAQVSQYAMLQKIAPAAWEIVKVTTFQANVTDDTDGAVTEKVTTVTFTEGLLRDILPLRRKQVELCRLLAIFTRDTAPPPARPG